MLNVISAHAEAFLAKFRSEEGAGIVEYLLLIVAIALLVLAAMTLFSNSLSTTFGEISDSINNAPTN